MNKLNMRKVRADPILRAKLNEKARIRYRKKMKNATPAELEAIRKKWRIKKAKQKILKQQQAALLTQFLLKKPIREKKIKMEVDTNDDEKEENQNITDIYDFNEDTDTEDLSSFDEEIDDEDESEDGDIDMENYEISSDSSNNDEDESEDGDIDMENYEISSDRSNNDDNDDEVHNN